MLQTQNVDAIIVIGCVIQGETKHFDFVCEGVTQGIKDLNVQSDVPVYFCVLTDNTNNLLIEVEEFMVIKELRQPLRLLKWLLFVSKHH
jgi:6,7-dimethyl-8-ribityllumazine synthase